jgi:hypothetical protein
MIVPVDFVAKWLHQHSFLSHHTGAWVQLQPIHILWRLGRIYMTCYVRCKWDDAA